MSIQFHTRAAMPVPAERVYAALIDLECLPGWMPSIIRLDILTPGPIRLGSRWREVRMAHGRELSEELCVTAFRSPSMLGLSERRTGRFPSECIRIYTLVPQGDAVEIEVRGEIPGLTGVRKVLGRAAVAAVREECDRGLRALRSYLAATQP